MRPFVQILVVYVSSLLGVSTPSSFLIRVDISTPFLRFPATYCSTLYCNFSKFFLNFLSLVPSTVPSSVTLSLKVFGILAFFFFLVSFIYLSLLLDLSVLFSVRFLLFSEGMGMWPACVYLPILFNAAHGHLLVRFLIPFFILCGSSVLWVVSCSLFFLFN